MNGPSTPSVTSDRPDGIPLKPHRFDFLFDLTLLAGFGIAIWLHTDDWVPYLTGGTLLAQLLHRWAWPRIRGFEYIPEDPPPPETLSVNEVRRRYPGAL